MSAPAARHPDDGNRVAVEQWLIDHTTRLVSERRRRLFWIAELVDWIGSDCTVYDPTRDRYAVQLPGDLVRRLRALIEP